MQRILTKAANVVKVKLNEKLSVCLEYESVTFEERRTHFNTLNTHHMHGWKKPESHFHSPARIFLDCTIITVMLHMQLMFGGK